jgi:hypothetical protein
LRRSNSVGNRVAVALDCLWAYVAFQREAWGLLDR